MAGDKQAVDNVVVDASPRAHSRQTLDSDKPSAQSHDTEAKHPEPTSETTNQPEQDTKTTPHHPAAAGVAKVEAFNAVLRQSGPSGKLLLYTLIASIALTMFAYALDQGITYQFTAMAASSFHQHSKIGAISTASQIVRAVSKPFIGKMADITSRPTTYVVVLVFYVVGFVVAASGRTIGAYAVGYCFTAFGKSGLDLLGDVIVGDLTTLQWRGFWGALLSSPFIVTTFVNGFISDAFIPDKWRWGLGMFAIMVPVLLLPAIATLYAMQAKAKGMGMVSAGGSKMARTGQVDAGTTKGPGSYLKFAWQGVIDIDLAGLILLGFAFALILLPLNLYSTAAGGWSNASMIAMIVTGFVLLLAFAAFEAFLAPRPCVTRAIVRNRAFLAAVGVDITLQMGSGVHSIYFASYTYVIKEWSNYNWTLFNGTVTLVLCLMGPITGLILAKTHRFKTLMVVGACLKLIGYSIQMDGQRSTRSTPALVMSQLLSGMSSFTVVGARVGSQASVPHEDLAAIIAQLSLWSTLASSVGYSIAGAIWNERMLPNMRRALPGTPESTLQELFASIADARSYAWGSEIRDGAIDAYTRTNGVIFIVAIAISAVTVLFCLVMPSKSCSIQ